MEDLCKSIKIYNKNIIIDIFPLKTEYKNKNIETETREQNIIIISYKEMIPFLSQEKATQFGIDCTFRIIPKSLKPYKMMSFYAIIIDNIKKSNNKIYMHLIKIYLY